MRSSVWAALTSFGLASALRYPKLVPPTIELNPIDLNGIQTGHFQQLIDHNQPELGTFDQRYYYNADWWTPGSPVIFLTPGEIAVDGYEAYASNFTMPGVIGQRAGAAMIVIEHRYWGESSPYDQLTTQNMQYQTLYNAVHDLVNFAENATLPFDTNRTSTPDKAPWILSGCSYSGALSAWTHALAPGTFWGYQCSSAVVEAIDELWDYNDVVQQAMPANCSADVVLAVDAIDEVLLGTNETAKTELKAKFGLADLEHDADFASVLTTPFGTWQSTDFAQGYGAFFQFCDYVENQWPGSNESEPTAAGVGAEKAINGYAKYIVEEILPGACQAYGYSSNSTACLDSYNATNAIYTDVTVGNNEDRQWFWFLCNEAFEWWFTRGQSKIYSRLLDLEYSTRQCELYFPTENGYTFGLNKGITYHDVNRRTGGWYNVNTTRLMWTVGELDPWRGATVASAQRPDGVLQSTPQHPVNIIPGAAHCGDQIMDNAYANEGAMKVIEAEVTLAVQWIGEFYQEFNKTWPKYPSGAPPS